MSDPSVEVLLSLNIGLDARTKEELTRNLREEILYLDEVGVADPVSGDKSASGTKGIDPAWGQLLLTVAASGGVLTTLINMLPAWLNRHNQRSLTITIGGDTLVVRGISTQQQQALIDAWIGRHQYLFTAEGQDISLPASNVAKREQKNSDTPKEISSDLWQQLRQILVQQDVFESDQALEAIFIEERLRHWQMDLPHANSRNARAELVIKWLYSQENHRGENGLFLLLQVLRDRTSQEISDFRLLDELAQALQK